jgi:hypothetical protein
MTKRISFDKLPEVVAELSEKLDKTLETVLEMKRERESIITPGANMLLGDDVLTVQDTAKLLGYSVLYTRRLYIEGNFVIKRVGKRVFITKQSVRDFIDKRNKKKTV